LPCGHRTKTPGRQKRPDLLVFRTFFRLLARGRSFGTEPALSVSDLSDLLLFAGGNLMFRTLTLGAAVGGALLLGTNSFAQQEGEVQRPGGPVRRALNAAADAAAGADVDVAAPGGVQVDVGGANSAADADVAVQAAGANVAVGAGAARPNANRWRYRWHNNSWWYWTPRNSWVIWRGGQWVPYGANYTYANPTYSNGNSNYYYDNNYYGQNYYGPQRYYSGYRGAYGPGYGRGGYYGQPIIRDPGARQGAVIGGTIGGAVGGREGAAIGAGVGAAVGRGQR